ncbi:hypothetical protein BGX33_009318 [Mortierella sp. NVP41]|nr:hypothetical protein BGX33_009318 [Mortierella sp. NVP41]
MVTNNYEPLYSQERFDRVVSTPISIEDGQAQVNRALVIRDTILTRRGVLLNQQLDLEDDIAAMGSAATVADKDALAEITRKIELVDKQVINSYEYTHKIIDHVEACNEGTEILYPYPDDYDLLVYFTDVLYMHRKATEPEENEEEVWKEGYFGEDGGEGVYEEEDSEDSEGEDELIDGCCSSPEILDTISVPDAPVVEGSTASQSPPSVSVETSSVEAKVDPSDTTAAKIGCASKSKIETTTDKTPAEKSTNKPTMVQASIDKSVVKPAAVSTKPLSSTPPSAEQPSAGTKPAAVEESAVTSESKTKPKVQPKDNLEPKAAAASSSASPDVSADLSVKKNAEPLASVPARPKASVFFDLPVPSDTEVKAETVTPEFTVQKNSIPSKTKVATKSVAGTTTTSVTTIITKKSAPDAVTPKVATVKNKTVPVPTEPKIAKVGTTATTSTTATAAVKAGSTTTTPSEARKITTSSTTTTKTTKTTKTIPTPTTTIEPKSKIQPPVSKTILAPVAKSESSAKLAPSKTPSLPVGSSVATKATTASKTTGGSKASTTTAPAVFLKTKTTSASKTTGGAKASTATAAAVSKTKKTTKDTIASESPKDTVVAPSKSSSKEPVTSKSSTAIAASKPAKVIDGAKNVVTSEAIPKDTTTTTTKNTKDNDTVMSVSPSNNSNSNSNSGGAGAKLSLFTKDLKHRQQATSQSNEPPTPEPLLQSTRQKRLLEILEQDRNDSSDTDFFDYHYGHGFKPTYNDVGDSDSDSSDGYDSGRSAKRRRRSVDPDCAGPRFGMYGLVAFEQALNAMSFKHSNGSGANRRRVTVGVAGGGSGR